MEAADESASRQVEPGRDSPILVTFRQAGLTPIEPAPLPIGVVYAYNSDIAAGRKRSPSQLSASCDGRGGAAARRGLPYHEDVQRADSCASDEAMSGGDSSGSAAAGIKRSGSRIAWLSPRRRSQRLGLGLGLGLLLGLGLGLGLGLTLTLTLTLTRAQAEREEREVEQAMDGDDEPGAEMEHEPFGGEGLEWIRGRNDAQSGGATHKLPMAPPPTSRLPRMLVKALSGARRSAARRDAGAAPAAATPAAATRATRTSASSDRASADGSVAFGCDCAVAAASSSSLPHRAAPHGDGRSQSRRSHRTSEEVRSRRISEEPDLNLATSESSDPHPRRALSGPGADWRQRLERLERLERPELALALGALSSPWP